MGKYSDVIRGLPYLPLEQGSWQDQVSIVKAQITERSITELAKRYRDLRIQKDQREAEEKVLNTELEAVKQLLFDAAEEAGVSSVRLADDGSSITVQHEPYAGIEDRESFRQWCISIGLETQMTLPWMTANNIVKERLLNGEAPPPGVKIFVNRKPVWRKG